MPLMPKRVKYRKVQKGSRGGMAKAGTTLAFGEYGLQALERDQPQSETQRETLASNLPGQAVY